MNLKYRFITNKSARQAPKSAMARFSMIKEYRLIMGGEWYRHKYIISKFRNKPKISAIMWITMNIAEKLSAISSKINVFVRNF